MAKLMLPIKQEYETLANKIMEYNLVKKQNILVNNTGEYITLEGKIIEIPRSIFNGAFSNVDSSNQDLRWKSLILIRKGNVITNTKHLIIVGDEKPKKPTVLVKNETKQLITEWSEKLSIDQQDFVHDAVKFYIEQFEKL